MTSRGTLQDYHSTGSIRSKVVKPHPLHTETSQLQDQHKQEWESKAISAQKEIAFQKSLGN